MSRFALLVLVSTLFISATPAFCQGVAVNQSGGYTASGGDAGTENTPTWGDYNGPSQQTGSQAYATDGQQVLGRMPAPEVPHVFSQTATGMPIPGTYIAPANLALQVENHSMFGGALPITNLDSFVAQSGYNDMIYGDEGTDGPPPYGDFATIGSGGVSATTGHASALPSAWGTPY